jgi:hypothetical protein
MVHTSVWVIGTWGLQNQVLQVRLSSIRIIVLLVSLTMVGLPVAMTFQTGLVNFQFRLWVEGQAQLL